jgi:hypothetical protein
MKKKQNLICLGYMLILTSLTHIAYSVPNRTQLVVWANEAIITTYTFDYKNFMQNQKDTAKYFTSAGWIAYSNALNDSKLLEEVQKNNYEVTAVATQPPILTTLDPTHWQVTMSILVEYKNAQNKQQQNLKIQLGFNTAPAGQGVRGLAVNSLKSTVIKPPCQCVGEKETSLP